MTQQEKEFIKKTNIKNLSLISCGPVPPNPAELISSDKMKELLEKLKAEFDIIIIDGAPVLPVTDSVILSSIVDKVVIVATHNETHKEELKTVKNTLENVGASIAGVVLNKFEMKNNGYSKYSKYGKGYYGGYYSNDESSNK